MNSRLRGKASLSDVGTPIRLASISYRAEGFWAWRCRDKISAGRRMFICLKNVVINMIDLFLPISNAYGILRLVYEDVIFSTNIESLTGFINVTSLRDSNSASISKASPFLYLQLLPMFLLPLLYF